MSAATPAAPAERFARLIDGLCRAVAARGGGRGVLAGPLVILIWSRLRGILSRVSALAAGIAAGRHRRILSRRPPRPAPRLPASPRRLPQSHAWLVRLVPEAAHSAAQLQHLLADPAFAALLDAAPQMRRLLRPLGRMLGVSLPPCPATLAPPARAPVMRTPPPAFPAAPSAPSAAAPPRPVLPASPRARPPPQPA
jgi:hypothetical protein